MSDAVTLPGNLGVSQGLASLGCQLPGKKAGAPRAASRCAWRKGALRAIQAVAILERTYAPRMLDTR